MGCMCRPGDWKRAWWLTGNPDGTPGVGPTRIKSSSSTGKPTRWRWASGYRPIRSWAGRETTADAPVRRQPAAFAVLAAQYAIEAPVAGAFPTRGLDVRSADYTWQLLYKRREHGTAILFISADLDEIIEHSDRIAVFSGGVSVARAGHAPTTAEEFRASHWRTSMIQAPTGDRSRLWKLWPLVPISARSFHQRFVAAVRCQPGRGVSGRCGMVRLAGRTRYRRLAFWAPLLLASAGLVITFTAGLWNIGVEGQIISEPSAPAGSR